MNIIHYLYDVVGRVKLNVQNIRACRKYLEVSHGETRATRNVIQVDGPPDVELQNRMAGNKSCSTRAVSVRSEGAER